MAKSLRCKREKRLRAIKRELVEPIYEKKEAAKQAILEAALAAPKLPVRSTTASDNNATAAIMDVTVSSTMATNGDMDVDMAEDNQVSRSLKPMGKKMKKRIKINKKKYRGKGKVRRKQNI